MIRKEYYIGMDLHKYSVQMAVFTERGEEPIYERRLNNDTALLIKEVKRYSKEGKTEAAYEAGCLGYVIQHEIDEATRDMLQCREDVSGDLRRVKQRLLKFLVRHGYIFSEGRSNWTVKHWKWMNGIQFGQEYERTVYEEYRSQIRGLEERLTQVLLT